MDQKTSQLYRLIKQYHLDWRHPKELERVVRRIEKDRLRPEQVRRWMKRIKPWAETQQRCFNPFPPAPSQKELGEFDIEIGTLKERSDVVRVGLRISDRPRHVICCGETGSGKSNLLRRIIFGLDKLNRSADQVHNHSCP